jgi:hypothetical protein
MQCVYQAAKALKNGAFGAKNQSATRINFSFLIWQDQEGSFRSAAIVLSRRCFSREIMVKK